MDTLFGIVIFLANAPVGVFAPSAPQLPRYDARILTLRGDGSILVVQLYKQRVL